MFIEYYLIEKDLLQLKDEFASKLKMVYKLDVKLTGCLLNIFAVQVVTVSNG